MIPMKQHILIAAMGEEVESIFPIIRAFPTEKIVLIANHQNWKDAQDLKEQLSVFRIPIKVNQVDMYSIDEIFKVIKNITQYEKDKELLINVTAGDKITSCFTLCAAYVYGLNAVAVMGEEVIMLPIMKFSYYKTISDPKRKILRVLFEKGKYTTLDELRNETSMSPPLLSYHLNGTADVDGLKQLGLVESREPRKNIEIQLSDLGKMLMAGYL